MNNPPAKSSAKTVKIIATLVLVAGLLVTIIGNASGASDMTVFLGVVAFIGGLLAFVVGRFME